MSPSVPSPVPAGTEREAREALERHSSRCCCCPTLDAQSIDSIVRVVLAAVVSSSPATPEGGRDVHDERCAKWPPHRHHGPTGQWIEPVPASSTLPAETADGREALEARLAETERALDYSNRARDIMRAEKEHGWREAERWEARAEGAEARLAAMTLERDEYRDGLVAAKAEIERLEVELNMSGDAMAVTFTEEER